MKSSCLPDGPSIPKEATAQERFSCPGCGGEMIQKSKARLLAVGSGMIASIGIAFFVPLFLAPGIILALTGVYLVVWATLGEARWCRNCKKFNLQPRADSIQ